MSRSARTAMQRFMRLPEDELRRLLALAQQADSVELKVLVPEPAHEEACAALGADLRRAGTRRVYFLDTADLALHRHGVVARVRSIDGGRDDSVVKLRPAVPSRLPLALRRHKRFVVEVDGMPGGYVCSAALKKRLGRHDVNAALSEGRPLRGLFSPAQRALIGAHAPRHVRIDDLAVLGPVRVRRCTLTPALLGQALAVERWTYPDGSRIVELSTRCPARAAPGLAARTAEVLAACGVDLDGPQQTKTRITLDFFQARVGGPTPSRRG
jgi:hypothetical protein